MARRLRGRRRPTRKGGGRAALADVTDDREYVTAFDRYEFLRSMLEIYYTLGEICARRVRGPVRLDLIYSRRGSDR